MEKDDDRSLCEINDDELLMACVIKGDHELLFLDTYLGEMLRS